MKIIASIIFLLTINLCLAQLYVRNDAFVFVKDQIVFVEDNVNLNEPQSSIYLRDEGQLIQGSGTTGNSGVGELSVYQNGNVGEYEYNYWCSPLGSKTSNSVNNPFGISFLNDATGLITSTPAGYTHDSSYNGTSSPLNIEPYWIYKYITSDSYYGWVHVRENTTIEPGEGFTMKGTAGSGDNQLYDFRGKPNTGDIAVSVDNLKQTLVGNPYPSALDAREYIWDTDNITKITGTLYYWEQDPSVNSHYIREYDGGYASYTIDASGTLETYVPATFNKFNGDGTINGAGAGSPSGKTPRRYIPIGQGFMVEGIANGMVIAKNSHRVFEKESGGSSEFFKSSNTKEYAKMKSPDNGFSKVPIDYKRFRLNVDFNNSYTRQLVETFHTTATTGFDRGLESKINSENLLASDAHWVIDENSYVAEALPFEKALKIPLVIKVASNMTVGIRISDIQNFDGNVPIYVHDIENDTYFDLKTQDFNMNLEVGNYTNRFEITFSNNKSLNTSEDVFEQFKVFQNNSLSSLKIINPNLLDIKTFSLFDVSGKQVLNDSELSTEKEYTFSTKSLSDGVYIAKIESSNNQVLSKKIVVSNTH